MAAVPPGDDLGALSYLGLRRAIGVIALALPPVLAVGRLLVDGGPWPGSISAYYYTSMRNVFVGALCALAVFLFSYRYQRTDNRLSTAAALLALGVALFPTAGPGPATTGESWIRFVHLFCAAGFFVILAVFSLFIFTRTAERPSRRKLERNRVYVACGATILASLVLAVVNALLGRWVDGYAAQDYNALFWLETAAVEAFGVSWLVKGGFLLAD